MSDTLCINTIRCLCAEAIQAANSGHPGAPLGCAPMAHTLFSKFMQVEPTFKWVNRDRFVLSNGHGSSLHYSLLHLLGVEDVSLDQLKNFRKLHSKTPGHPERGLTTGIEMTTGPLGQGIASAVGMAIARNHLAAKFNKPNFDLFNHFIYTIVGDGCLQEGVAHEACSLAGHLGLGGLIALYDDNSITIDGRTEVSFTEDVPARFRALGWETITVNDGNNDLEGIADAIRRAQSIKSKPVLISVKTIIGYGSKMADTSKVHGSPLGVDGILHLKKTLGMPEDKSFYVPDEVYSVYNQIAVNGTTKMNEWNKLLSKYQEEYPELHQDLSSRISGNYPTADELYDQMVSSFAPEQFTKPNATRETSHMCINSITKIIPSIIGGSADLAASNKTDIKGELFMTRDDFSPKNIRFGIREHGMAAICNGIAAYGLVKPFCATFMVFSPYLFGALRLSAMSHLPVVYVLTHDSLAVGEDGATHMPIGELSQLREIPNLDVYRPSDLRETILAYSLAFSQTSRPSIIIGSRQNIKPPCALVTEQMLENYKPSKYIMNGFIPIKESNNKQLAVFASGSEAGMAAAALKDRSDVSLYSVMNLDRLLKNFEFLNSLSESNTLSVELSTPGKWYLLNKFSSSHDTMAVHDWGLSGPADEVLAYFGFTEQAVVEKVDSLIGN
ncbi:hypothetical protein RCL1_000096 [Eukaryota sp. TZLM3-RCL]